VTTTFAALLYKPAEIPDRALSQGFAVALGGWDVPSPRLQVAQVPGLPEHHVAFYVSGAAPADAAEHLCDLFEDELSPAVAVLDAAAELGHPDAVVHAVVYSEEFIYDDGWRLDASGFERHFVRDGEDGIEHGIETADESQIETLPLDIPEDATDAEETALVAAAIKPHRGTTFLSSALGIEVLPALMRSLFDVERKIEIRFVEPAAEVIGRETERLVRALGRTPGRGACSPPVTASGAVAPAAVAAFIQAYDWHDPRDPEDLYRELAIGAVEGTLRFLREAEIRALDTDPFWKSQPAAGLYPIAKLMGSALGAQRAQAILAVSSDGDRLFVVRPGRPPGVAGPTFGELLRYLALGWSRRSQAEEDLIGALMLRARLRVDAARVEPARKA
jgi:hypothetical protein